ncbi:sperm-associated antigen 4 protein-like isoform 1-T1 [Guaruba guarouba]
MREAMSDPMEVSDWALRSTGTAIDLQESSSTSARLRRVFWSLFSQPFEDTFVQGLDEEGQDETLLGSFIYSMQKEPTQSFPLQNGIPRAFRLVKLGIQSNWGKPGYTCIYRVQVHGKMVETNVIGKTHVETFPR